MERHYTIAEIYNQPKTKKEMKNFEIKEGIGTYITPKDSSSTGTISFKIGIPAPPTKGEAVFNFFEGTKTTKHSCEIIRNKSNEVCGVLVVYRDKQINTNNLNYSSRSPEEFTENIEIKDLPQNDIGDIALLIIHEQKDNLFKKNILNALAYLIETTTPQRGESKTRESLSSEEIKMLLDHIINGENKKSPNNKENDETFAPPITANGGVLKPGTI